jgi:hypothetical protein
MAYIFCATLQLRTPLRVLCRHGEICEKGRPPGYARELWEGIWIQLLPRQRALFGNTASEIGPVPTDGGVFLSFLKAVRQVAEGEGSPTGRRQLLGVVLSNDRWKVQQGSDALMLPITRSIVDLLGGSCAIQDKFFPRFIDSVGGVRRTTADDLWSRGIRTPQHFAQRSDADLLAVPGIGKAKLIAIREACARSAWPLSEYADLVGR